MDMTTKLTDHLPPSSSVLIGGIKHYAPSLPHQLIEEIARASASSTAAVYGKDAINYRTLNNQANQLAQILLNRGITTGDRCAVLIKPSLDILISILAIHKIGATYLPLDPDAPIQRQEFILEDANPSIIIYHKATNDAALLKNFSTLGLDTIEFTLEPKYDLNPEYRVSDDDIANIFYTSGTTGHPKGVLATYKNYRHYICAANDRFSMSALTVMPAIAKFTFSISLFELIAPLASGGTVRLIDRDAVLTPNKVIEELKQCTMAHIGPSLWLRILSTIEQNNLPPSEFDHFQHASSGGDIVPPELLNRLSSSFPKAEIYVIYGCSEISCMGTAFFVDRNAQVTKTYVGTPFCNTQVAIINYHTQRLVPVGDKGEICFYSDGVASAYIGKLNSFAKKVISIEGKNYYRTGDIGRITEKQQLEMFGREDFQVKVNGVRIELSEIDYHLRKAPHIEQAISMAWRADDGENKIYAYITNQISPQQIAEARAYLQENLMEQMQPKSFIYVEALPLNINLKVDRKALPKPTQENIIRESEYGAATTKTQKQLLKIWQSLIGRSEIGIDDDFFYSGGSSLQGVDLMEQIDRTLKTNLSLNTLMSNRTIRELARIVDDDTPNQADSKQSILIKNTNCSENLFFIHDGNGEAIPYFSISKALDTKHTIYGITPPRRGRADITESSFEDLSKNYADEILKIQQSGPYILGGLCIGGYIAYCVAAELEKRGHKVTNVILFDSHYIDATPKSYAQQQRKERLSLLISQFKANLFNPIIAFKTVVALTKKIFNFIAYKVSSTTKGITQKLRIKTLAIIKRHPSLANVNLPYPDVDSVLRYAEKNFSQRPKCQADLILFKAIKALDTLNHLNIDDTPYCNYFEGDDLGWSKIHGSNLKIYPIGAGHSTLLTPPYSEEIARTLSEQIS